MSFLKSYQGLIKEILDDNLWNLIKKNRGLVQDKQIIPNKMKTKYTLFHKKSSKDDLPLKLPALKIADKEIEKKTAMKFLGVMLDENISWEEHICPV